MQTHSHGYCIPKSILYLKVVNFAGSLSASLISRLLNIYTLGWFSDRASGAVAETKRPYLTT